MPWAVVMAKPNCEGMAVVNLQRQGYDVYFPRFRFLSPKKTVVIKPLFPRYLFVSFEKVWYSIRGTRGVSHVLIADEGPATVPATVIDALRAREDLEGFIQLGKRTPIEKFDRGQSVKATEGPLVGLPLIYEGMTAKDRVKVLVEILGRKTLVTVKENSLVAA